MNLKQFGKMEPVNPWTKLVIDIDSEIKVKRDIMMNMPLSDVSELKAICKRIGDLEDKRGSLILAEMRVRHSWNGEVRKTHAQRLAILGQLGISAENFCNGFKKENTV